MSDHDVEPSSPEQTPTQLRPGVQPTMSYDAASPTVPFPTQWAPQMEPTQKRDTTSSGQAPIQSSQYSQPTIKDSGQGPVWDTHTSTAPPRKSSRRWLLVGLLVALVVVIIIVLALPHDTAPAHDASNGNPVPYTPAQSFHVGDDAAVIIKAHHADVSVHTNTTDVIAVVPRNHGTTVLVDPKNVMILYTQGHDAQGHDTLTVTTDPWFRDVDFAITMPGTARVQITVDNGSADIHGGHGAALNTGSGSAELDSVQGPVSIQTDNGDVTANDITGPLTIGARNGSIHMLNVKGQVQATTVSGDVIARTSAFSGQSQLQTQNGSVRFGGSIEPGGSYTMQTTNGDVDVTLPSNAAFALSAGTNSGSVQNAFGSNSIGDTPRATLSLHTTNGSVLISKAP